MTLLFNLAMLVIVPFWLLMIAAPRWRWTKRLTASPWVAIGPAAIYALVVLPRFPAVISVFNPPTVEGLAAFLATDAGAVIAWAHFLAFDLLVGRWIYLDSRANGINPWLMVPILFMAFMLAPLGWLAYMLVRIPFADDPLRSQAENRPTVEPSSEGAGFSPARFMRAGLAYWRGTSTAQRTLFITGSGLFVWMVAHIGLMLVSSRPIDGPTSFRKAATFAETGWLMCWAVGYALPYLRIGKMARRALVGGVLLFGGTETLLMSIQVWRGVPSHYNFTTPFNSALFGTTGIIAAVWLASMGVLMAALLRENDFAPSMRLAYIAGTALMIVGGVTGFLMMFNLSGVYQGELLANMQTLVQGEMLGTFAAGGVSQSEGGSIVVIHALGVHGLSVVPLLAWLLGYTSLSSRTRITLTAVGAGGYIGLMLVLGVVAFRAVPLSEMGLPATVIAGALAVPLVGAYALAAWRGLPSIGRRHQATSQR